MGSDRSVYAPDTPGFGASDGPAPQPGIAAHAAAIGDVIDHLRLRKVDLLGYHSGASIAAELAIKRPEQVRRVVMVGVPTDLPGVTQSVLVLRPKDEPSGAPPHTLAGDYPYHQFSLLCAARRRILAAFLLLLSDIIDDAVGSSTTTIDPAAIVSQLALMQLAGDPAAALAYQVTRALDCYRRLLQADPLSEPACQRLMLLYAQRGMRNAALKTYETCCQAIRREIGSEPDEVTTSIYRKILEMPSSH